MSIHQGNQIPISPTLNNITRSDIAEDRSFSKKRLSLISGLAVLVAFVVCVVAKGLVLLINLVTNVAFYASFDLVFREPKDSSLGLLVVVLPVIGGLIVGLIALYGSKAIRGHGIPEAMEQILTNESRIKPSIAFLKPISSAIAIGTGGPFGAEGPIIATGGALGSTLGQLIKVTPNERKVILAAGATAGMSAIFGTPIAAIFLAIELLLFEFSPLTILPVAFACITGAAGHHLLFEEEPVFTMAAISAPTNQALLIYSLIGATTGILACGITKLVYWIEDLFEKLPIHWMWWPAIGGLAVGVIGYFYPATLGVGYSNISAVLSGKTSLTIMSTLCLFKLISWAISLGSGTSGGTLAPLLTIGGAFGGICGSIVLLYYPDAEISIALAALVGMSAMFAGASRAYLTSIAFALESTMQSNALLPLLGGCTGSYLISLFLMENTIMTEKIARRGVYTPNAYQPDMLRKTTVREFMQSDVSVLELNETVDNTKRNLIRQGDNSTFFLLITKDGHFEGILERNTLFRHDILPESTISQLSKNELGFVKETDSLAKAVEIMANMGEVVLPVISSHNEKVISGLIAYKDMLPAYRAHHKASAVANVHLSIKKVASKLLRSNKIINSQG